MTWTYIPRDRQRLNCRSIGEKNNTRDRFAVGGADGIVDAEEFDDLYSLIENMHAKIEVLTSHCE